MSRSFYQVQELIAIDWSEFLLDVVLPKTDRVVAIQWAVVGAIWLVLIALSWQYDRDIRHFLWGITLSNFAWFLARMIH